MRRTYGSACNLHVRPARAVQRHWRVRQSRIACPGAPGGNAKDTPR